VYNAEVPRLVAIEGPNRGAVLELREGENRLGRHRDVELVLPDKHVSREHARIDWSAAAGATLHDLESRNATYINGVRLTVGSVLQGGDEIRLGDTTLVFVDETAQAPSAPPSDGADEQEETAPLLERPGALDATPAPPSPPGPSAAPAHVSAAAPRAPAAATPPPAASALRLLSRPPAVPDTERRASTPVRYLIGEGPAMRRVAELVARCAPLETTVLVKGETGTGKELVAEALHRLSARRHEPFVAVNCATLEPALLESELFGHEKGAFTGAHARKTGLLEVARAGTILLDEVGEMPLGAQAKLLRVLESRRFQRLGGTQPLTTGARIVAATHRDLAALARDGRFREDLLFRVRVAEIVLPPLRERPDDLPELIAHFLSAFRKKIPTRVDGVTAEALACLARYRFPGNVRELKNIIERCLIFSDGDKIRVRDLPREVLHEAGLEGALSRVEEAEAREAAEAPPPEAAIALPPALDDELRDDPEPEAAPSEETPPPAAPLEALDPGPVSLSDMERRHIAAILERTGWNKSRAAQLLDIDRATLYAKIRQYGLARGAEA